MVNKDSITYSYFMAHGFSHAMSETEALSVEPIQGPELTVSAKARGNGPRDFPRINFTNQELDAEILINLKLLESNITVGKHFECARIVELAYQLKCLKFQYGIYD